MLNLFPPAGEDKCISLGWESKLAGEKCENYVRKKNQHPLFLSRGLMHDYPQTATAREYISQ